MSKTAGQNLSLGKLKRAVDGTDSYTTANTSLACLLYTSPSPRDVEESRMPSSA